MDNEIQDLNQEQDYTDPSLDSAQADGSTDENLDQELDQDVDIDSDSAEDQGQGDDVDIDDDDEDFVPQNQNKVDPNTKVPYYKLQKKAQDAKFWREVAEGKRPNPYATPQEQAPAPTQTQPLTPEQEKAKREEEIYKARIKQLGFTPNEEVEELKKKVDAIEAERQKDIQAKKDAEFKQRVETRKQSLAKEAEDLSKKYPNFNYEKVANWALKNPKKMALANNLEEIYILSDPYGFASEVTSQNDNGPHSPGPSAPDNGGNYDAKKLSREQLKEVIAKKNGRKV